MALVDISRPDILMFINAKSIQNVWRHFTDTMSPCLGGVFEFLEKGNFNGAASFIHSFYLFEFCSPLPGFFSFVPGFSEYG